MVEAQVAAALAQFGVAGLIGWMWLWERRSAAQRERETSESHRRLMEDRDALDALITTLQANTRALTMLEGVHRELVGALRSAAPARPGTPAHRQETPGSYHTERHGQAGPLG